jgi:hypothetical protein
VGSLYVASDHGTFEFSAFIDLLNDLEPALSEPCNVIIDLSTPGFFGPSGMVPLLALIADLSTKGWSIKVAPPSAFLEEYWEKAGWIAALKGEDPAEPMSMSTFVPLAHYQSREQMNERVNLLMDVLAKVSDFEPGVLMAVQWTISELADNVLNHSGGAVGWLQIIARPSAHRVDLVVADRGLGIRETIRQGFPEVTTDAQALRLSIEKGTTRDSTVGQGNGLAC